MTREEILGEAATRRPHPRYGLLTAFKYDLLNRIECTLLAGDIDTEQAGRAWTVCTLDPDDELIAKLTKDNAQDLKKFWGDALHASEVKPFIEWFFDELTGADAAATEDVPDKQSGKSESRQPAPTG